LTRASIPSALRRFAELAEWIAGAGPGDDANTGFHMEPLV
jgi:hypothetical protein